MSWPSDGLPRFVVVETRGLFAATVGGSDPRVDNTNENRTVAILDRAFCHREVAYFRSEDQGSTRGKAVAKAQRLAAERAAELNGEQVAA